MLDLLINNTSANVKLFHRFVADVPDDKMCTQFPTLPNHIAWQIGHVTFVRSVACQILGKPAELPADWASRYGRNSTPDSNPAAHPSKESLLALLGKTQDHLVAALRATDPASLNVPHDRTQMLPLFPTKMHLLFHILTTHDGLHLGQLGDVRRALGLPRVL